jgi:hypothetical protein
MKKIITLMAMLISSAAFAQIPGLSQPNVVGGNIILDSGPRWFYEQGTAPTHQSDRIVCYGKDVAGITELFCKSSAGVEVQITSGGSPVGAAQWLGETTLAYDGNDIGSLTLANTQCKTDVADPLARVCTDNDIIMLIASGSTFGGSTDEVWVHDGTPGYTANANNCDGWSSVAVTSYSGYWSLANKKGNLSGCAMSKKYACCK